MMDLATQPETVAQAFEQLVKRRSADADARKTVRERAFSQFSQAGWPTTKNEDWRFTNPKVLSHTSFVNPASLTSPELGDWATPYLLGEESPRLVFVDGQFNENLSRLDLLPNGCQIRSLGQVLRESPGFLNTHFQDHLRQAGPFGNLNTAFMEEGAVIQVNANVQLNAPIQILHLHHGFNHPPMVHPRVIVFAGTHSQASLVETYVGKDEAAYWTNNVTQIHLEDGAHFNHYMAQFNSETAYQVANLNAYLNRDSRLTCNHLMTGSALMRNNLTIHLRGQGADCSVNGLTLGHGNQVLDTHVEMNHCVPHCTSNQYFKTILDDKAHGIFGGRVVVFQEAQKTDAKQTNRNLLLSDDARIDAKPQLEIYADDVKCAHGATTGQLNEDALFYLASRGLNPKAAREVLIYAFAHEVLDRLEIPMILEQAEKVLLSRFDQRHLFGA